MTDPRSPSTQDWLAGGRYFPPQTPILPAPRQRAAQTSRVHARQLVIYPQDRADLTARFVKAAGKMGVGLADVFWEEGVRVVLVPKHLSASQVVLPDGSRLTNKDAVSQNLSLDHGAAGFFSPSRQLVVIRENHLDVRVTTHELAHALDHVFTRRLSLPVSLSTMLYEGFQATRKILADGYMMHGPHEYFAVSVELYFGRGGRAQLKRIDPEFLAFMDGIFG